MNTFVAHPSSQTHAQNHPAAARLLGDSCFIEIQFPVSKMSVESYTERKANMGQTLTTLGKWWGRKPLVLCRAAILGVLLPATENPQRDREVFLRLMTMDDDGLFRRKSATIPAKELFKRLPPTDRARYFETASESATSVGKNRTDGAPKLRRSLTKEEKQDLQRRVFLSMSYDERIEYCDRPEHIVGPAPESWAVINSHLGTTVSSLQELVAELGKRRFGHVPRVGDSFCGGGSIPFEAARIGCDAYGSDLNPIAALLTWAAFHIVGGGQEAANRVQAAQRKVYDAVDRQFTEWGIEHRELDQKTGRRWRADVYMYCVEVVCPECQWKVPLAPSWVIGESTKVVAKLVPDHQRKQFDFEVHSNVSDESMIAAAGSGTVKHAELVCPNCRARTPIKVIRGDGRGSFSDAKNLLRPWENHDVVPRRNDVFGERLYCIRWVDTWTQADRNGNQRTYTERHYAAPSNEDLVREQKVFDLLMERFNDWQNRGYIPSRKIEPGVKTNEPIRTRGWTHWHHLFNPRQLLTIGSLFREILEANLELDAKVGALLSAGNVADWNARLCQLRTSPGNEGRTEHIFYNQALNTFYNYGTRPLLRLTDTFLREYPAEIISGNADVALCDARLISVERDIWITDPPYADAIEYAELSEFFLAWYGNAIQHLFKGWYQDAKRFLAVKGDDSNFRTAMISCYQRLAECMPQNGIQVVMFTHQSASVWADLATILWSAGLKVSAAWCIATETGPAVGEGNYVQGTVLLVLRKRSNEETVFLDEVYQDVEAEVRRQLDSMRELEDSKDPNFADTDYQLGAYAAALRVLTSKKIEEIDVSYELTRTRKKGEKSAVEELIERAVKIACDHLVPKGIDTHLWKSLTALERLYLKGLELETHGEHRTGVYQELARGFGVEEYKPLLGTSKANETRLKTASEFARKEMNDAGFGASLVRHALFAIFKTVESETPRDGITWLKTEVKDYASSRQRVIEILEFLAARRQNASLPHWHKDAEAAGLLAGALRNRQDNV